MPSHTHGKPGEMNPHQSLDMPPEHRRLVLEILRAHLPPETKAWVFGSRATGGAWRYSDLDLALDAGRPLTLDELAILAEAFRESDLPHRVDVVDWRGLDDGFRRRIAPHRAALAEAAGPDGAIAAIPTEKSPSSPLSRARERGEVR